METFKFDMTDLPFKMALLLENYFTVRFTTAGTIWNLVLGRLVDSVDASIDALKWVPEAFQCVNASISTDSDARSEKGLAAS